MPLESGLERRHCLLGICKNPPLALAYGSCIKPGASAPPRAGTIHIPDTKPCYELHLARDLGLRRSALSVTASKKDDNEVITTSHLLPLLPLFLHLWLAARAPFASQFYETRSLTQLETIDSHGR
jgi:hypothetical protein